MNNFEALELELVAIFVELIMIQANSKVEVYMDSLVVVNIWRTLFLEDELKWEARKIWNINSIGLWKMIFMMYWKGKLVRKSSKEFMKKYNQCKFKADWLVLEINRSLRMHIVEIDIDWRVILWKKNLGDIWFSLDISDLLTYHRLIMFRSSQYVENYSI
ncbi:hypothetical protein RhiirA4_490585 [Rhizophagus irregularis]|uniref:RNase H type-1 domain-containing protein n=1 Tax=Rhizophagus irregularis TaxID=588596 RepID=A0A2I1HVV1_9GLOM|nr:hypothetical protein RhiirA4_490585 [Rhizophagus irregularis]